MRQRRTIEPPPAPLNAARVKSLLSDLRGLLAQETPAAAEALRTLTGPITIRQEAPPGSKRGAAWIATFKPDFIGWLRQRAKEKNCPEAVTLGYIGAAASEAALVCQARGGQAASVCGLCRGGPPAGGRWRVAQMWRKSLGLKYYMARYALRYAVSGERPRSKPTGLPIKIRTGSYKYQTLAPEVVRLRDKERFSFLRIGKHLGIHPATAEKAYAYGMKCHVGVSDSGVTKVCSLGSRLFPDPIHPSSHPAIRRGASVSYPMLTCRRIDPCLNSNREPSKRKLPAHIRRPTWSSSGFSTSWGG